MNHIYLHKKTLFTHKNQSLKQQQHKPLIHPNKYFDIVNIKSFINIIADIYRTSTTKIGCFLLYKLFDINRNIIYISP